MSSYIIALFITFTVAVISTPFIKRLANKIGAHDQPNKRKVHSTVIPSLGGLSIVLGTVVGYLYLSPTLDYIPYIIIGAFIMVTIGILDDLYNIAPALKFSGQILAALIVVYSGLKIEFLNLPFDGHIDLGILGYLFTIIWIVAITNTINLIDGLDGLAAGVSVIALFSILIVASLNNQFIIVSLSVILIGSILGFLVFNFYPAKIFMGDTGSLFLGYCISIISIIGLLKSVTMFTFIIPVIILAVPIFDTFFAIVRRILNKQKISAPDKSHLHHCILAMGVDHRTTVIIIYLYSAFFGIIALLFSTATLWGSFIIIGLLMLILQVTAEVVGLIGGKRKPLLNMLRKIIAVTQGLKS